MYNFSNGVTALSASQRLLDLVGQNLANVNTPGYRRQVASLAAIYTGGLTGSGVRIQYVRHMRNGLLDSAVTRSTSESSQLSARLGSLRLVESGLAPGDGSLNSLMEKFFNQLDQLTANPGDLSQRRVVLTNAASLAQRFNALAEDFGQQRIGLDARIQQSVADINSLAPQIAQLNEQIHRVEVTGQNANDLRDQRDQLINQLAAVVDVRTVEMPFGQTTVLAGGVPVVAGNQTVALQFSLDPRGNAQVTTAGSSEPLTVTGGQLAGALQSRNQVLPQFLGKLDMLARTFAQKVNQVQATGLGLGGGFEFLSSVNAALSTTAPLSQAGLAMPPQAGSLFLTVTETATGLRTLTEITIDPATQSLQDVANALSGVPGVQGVVDPQTGTLKVLSQPGYQFDFAGRVASAPTTTAITGTSTPQLGGAYTGSTNDTLTYRVVGSGTVGVTPNLRLEVRNSAGSLLTTLNIGQGYEPGAVLKTGDGLTLEMAAGTLNDGDNFTVRVVGQPDTAGLLSSVGLNGFFTGTSATTLAVRPELLTTPELLAASRSGQPGDAANLRQMTALRDAKSLGNGTQSFHEFATALVADAGVQTQDVSQRLLAQEALGERLDAEWQALSGVDPNEELVAMLQYQRSFEMASRYIGVVNDTLGELLQMVR